MVAWLLACLVGLFVWLVGWLFVAGFLFFSPSNTLPSETLPGAVQVKA